MAGTTNPGSGLDSEGRNVVVCDNGTGLVKCGFAGDQKPRHVFGSIVGRPQLKAKTKIGDKVIELKDIMCGDDAAQVREYLEIGYPMEHGSVSNWTDMEHLWNYTFKEKLGICGPDYNCSGSKVLLTEPPSNASRNRETMFQYMFEKYQVDGVQCCIQAVLTLYGRGLMTGLVVDCGDGVTHICPVVQGCALKTVRLNLAGRDITKSLIQKLELQGYSFNESADHETIKKMKEELAYVAYDYSTEMKLAEETTVLVEKYKLPDGREIKVGSGRFECGECLFQPHLSPENNEQQGMAEMVFQTITDSALDVRADLYKHIVLSGGTTMLRGLPSRLEREVKQLHLKEVLHGDVSRLDKIKIKVEDPPSRGHLVFLGGAVLADIYRDEKSFWITKQEYEEHGVKRCIQNKSSGVTSLGS